MNGQKDSGTITRNGKSLSASTVALQLQRLGLGGATMAGALLGRSKILASTAVTLPETNALESRSCTCIVLVTHPIVPIGHLADTDAPLKMLNLRVPAPVLERLEAKAATINGSRAALARYVLLPLGLERLDQQTAAGVR